MNEREIFFEALDLTEPHRRSAYLETACAGDAALRQRIDALLRSEAVVGPFLQRSAIEQMAHEDHPPTVAGYVIGSRIGAGGMGEVYEARDIRLGRDVAIKCLRSRFGNDPVISSRFLDEARITATLQHPGIPPVHEVGRLSDGRPFLAMKRVAGRSLAELLSQSPHLKHDRAHWLAVFESVCQAVGFAHSRGVLHRDLKPSNVMVGAFGEVQVMDWGLARDLTVGESGATGSAVASQALDDTLGSGTPDQLTPVSARRGETDAGLVMGTPGFMAPEQARGEPVDARSDVYGLGAMLCMILTGGPPFSSESVRQTLDANARGDTAEAFDRLAACGADAELVELARRCLTLRPQDRPADAGEVAEALADWRTRSEARARDDMLARVAGEVRLGAERKRRRTVLRAATIIVTMAVLGGSMAAWLAVRATGAEARTAVQLERTQAAESRALVEAQNARAAAADAKAFGDFLDDNFLAATRPVGTIRGIGFDIKVSDALSKAEADITRVFAGQPVAEARAHHSVGVTWRNLGRYERAIPHLRKAMDLRETHLGPDDELTLESMNSLGVTYEQMGNATDAQPLLECVIERYGRTRGPSDPKMLKYTQNLADVFMRKQDYPAAERVYRNVLAHQQTVYHEHHAETLRTQTSLGVIAQARGDFATARSIYEKVLHAQEKTLGLNHPDLLNTMACLGVLELNLDPAAAERWFTRALAGQIRYHGPEHPETAYCQHHLGILHHRAGRPHLALPLLENALRIRRAQYGDTHAESLKTAYLYGYCLHAVGRGAEALPFLELTYAARDRDPTFAFAGVPLQAIYRTLARDRDAVRLLLEIWREGRSRLKPGSEEWGQLLGGIAESLFQLDPAAAEPVLRDCMNHFQQATPGGWLPARARSLIGGVLLHQRKYAAAEAELSEAYAALKANESKIPPQGGFIIPDTLDRLIVVATRRGDAEAAAKWKGERARYPREKAPIPRSKNP